MHTIVMATQKGGSGKSTLSIGLALAAQEAGHVVRLIETDKQGTLSNWQCRRGLAAEPTVEAVYNARDIERRLEALERGGVTLTIIDTAAGISAATTSAIRYSDLCMIPSRPSVPDIEATAATLSVARAWRTPFVFILNQTPIRAGHRVSEATAALDGEAPRDIADVLAQPFIVMRNDHQDALAAGLGVTEYAPSSKSAEEIRALWQWTEIKLNGGAIADEERASAYPDVEFPIVLTPASARKSIEPATERPLITWADTNISWDAGL
jgi:chromosome partitioning protein